MTTAQQDQFGLILDLVAEGKTDDARAVALLTPEEFARAAADPGAGTAGGDDGGPPGPKA